MKSTFQKSRCFDNIFGQNWFKFGFFKGFYVNFFLNIKLFGFLRFLCQKFSVFRSPNRFNLKKITVLKVQGKKLIAPSFVTDIKTEIILICSQNFKKIDVLTTFKVKIGLNLVFLQVFKSTFF